MNGENNPKTKLAMAIAVIIVVAVVGYLIYKYKYKEGPLEEPATLGGKVSEQVQNPGSAVPDSNPYDTKVNPYEVKVNPFRDTYQNPFK